MNFFENENLIREVLSTSELELGGLNITRHLEPIIDGASITWSGQKTILSYGGESPRTIELHTAQFEELEVAEATIDNIFRLIGKMVHIELDDDPIKPIYQLEGDDVDEELDRIFGKAEPNPMDMIDQQLGEIFGTEEKS